MRESLALRVPLRRCWEQRGVLTCGSKSMVATCWSRERPGIFLRARDFLAALLLLRWHLTERVPPKGHAPWSHGVFLERRWLVRPRSFVARAGRGAVQREGWCRGAPCGADELGDAVQPVLVEVVDWAVAQELACHEQRGLRVRGRVTSVVRWAGRSQQRGGGAAIPSHRRVQ